MGFEPPAPGDLAHKRFERVIRGIVTLGAILVGVPGAASEEARSSFDVPPVRDRGPVLTGHLGFGSPTGLLGATAGWHARGPRVRWSIEAGYGLGATGHQLALMGRLGPSRLGRLSVTFATGPSLALLGEGVGLPIEHRLDIDTRGKVYYASWWNTELGFEGRDRIFLRGVLGGSVRLAESMSPLCEGVVPGEDDTNPANTGCDPRHFRSAPEFAALKTSIYLDLAIGVRF